MGTLDSVPSGSRERLEFRRSSGERRSPLRLLVPVLLAVTAPSAGLALFWGGAEASPKPPTRDQLISDARFAAATEDAETLVRLSALSGARSDIKVAAVLAEGLYKATLTPSGRAACIATVAPAAILDFLRDPRVRSDANTVAWAVQAAEMLWSSFDLSSIPGLGETFLALLPAVIGDSHTLHLVLVTLIQHGDAASVQKAVEAARGYTRLPSVIGSTHNASFPVLYLLLTNLDNRESFEAFIFLLKQGDVLQSHAARVLVADRLHYISSQANPATLVVWLFSGVPAVLVRLAQLHKPTGTFADSETSTKIAGTLLKLAKCERGKEILIAAGAPQALRQLLDSPAVSLVGEYGSLSKWCLPISYRILAIPRALFALGYTFDLLFALFMLFSYLCNLLQLCSYLEDLHLKSEFRWLEIRLLETQSNIIMTAILLALMLTPWPKAAATFLNPVLPFVADAADMLLSLHSFL